MRRKCAVAGPMRRDLVHDTDASTSQRLPRGADGPERLPGPASPVSRTVPGAGPGSSMRSYRTVRGGMRRVGWEPSDRTKPPPVHHWLASPPARGHSTLQGANVAGPPGQSSVAGVGSADDVERRDVSDALYALRDVLLRTSLGVDVNAAGARRPAAPRSSVGRRSATGSLTAVRRAWCRAGNPRYYEGASLRRERQHAVMVLASCLFLRPVANRDFNELGPADRTHDDKKHVPLSVKSSCSGPKVR